MKYLLINSVCGFGSTGRICTEIADQLSSQGHEVKIAYGRMDNVPEKYRGMAVRIGTDTDMRIHGVMTRIFDAHGFASKSATRRFLAWAEAYRPDVVWLHNIHGYYINVEMLFAWLKKHPEMQVKWTLHDCWAFTGHCAYFTMAGCEQWTNHCEKCVKKKGYPASLLVDGCRRNFDRKRRAFTGVKNMTLITPSQWLKDLVKRSFLKDYPVEVVYNRINTDIFRPTPSDFRKEHGLEDKYMILGVANIWDARKGLADFMELAGMLDAHYHIVLVGLSEDQMLNLPANVLGIRRTASAQELAQIYSAADVFVNPSREETFGMTTVEAISCGTGAIVYAGSASEEIAVKYGGICVEPNVHALHNAILQFRRRNEK